MTFRLYLNILFMWQHICIYILAIWHHWQHIWDSIAVSLFNSRIVRRLPQPLWSRCRIFNVLQWRNCGRGYFLIDLFCHILCQLTPEVLFVNNKAAMWKCNAYSQFRWVVTTVPPFTWKKKISLAFDALDLSSLWYCRREEGNLDW